MTPTTADMFQQTTSHLLLGHSIFTSKIVNCPHQTPERYKKTFSILFGLKLTERQMTPTLDKFQTS